MKAILCFCFFCFSFSAFSQEDSTANDGSARRDSIISAKRDSVINSINKELNVPKGKMQSALTAFSEAADKINEVSNNDELSYDEKSSQIKLIVDNRDETLKSLLNEKQLARLKAYIIRRKIPRKMK